MRYDRFEDVPAWKAAARLYVEVEGLVEDQVFRGHGDLKSQLLRAALSISNNIAEGFERGTTAELIMFLYIAKGSAGECRSMLQVMLGSHRHPHLRSQISSLKSQSESVSRQLHGWLSSLQNSDIKGVRYLNEATRAVYDQRRRAERFTAYIAEQRDAATAKWIEQMNEGRVTETDAGESGNAESGNAKSGDAGSGNAGSGPAE